MKKPIWAIELLRVDATGDPATDFLALGLPPEPLLDWAINTEGLIESGGRFWACLHPNKLRRGENTEARSAAARENGKRGGRPRKIQG